MEFHNFSLFSGRDEDGEPKRLYWHGRFSPGIYAFLLNVSDQPTFFAGIDLHFDTREQLLDFQKSFNAQVAELIAADDGHRQAAEAERICQAGERAADKVIGDVALIDDYREAKGRQ